MEHLKHNNTISCNSSLKKGLGYFWYCSDMALLLGENLNENYTFRFFLTINSIPHICILRQGKPQLSDIPKMHRTTRHHLLRTLREAPTSGLEKRLPSSFFLLQLPSFTHTFHFPFQYQSVYFGLQMGAGGSCLQETAVCRNGMHNKSTKETCIPSVRNFLFQKTMQR